MIWLGDSFPEGTGADSRASSFVNQVCAAKGWACVNRAEGGTGYVARGPIDQFPDRRPIPGHVDRVIPLKPDLVIIAAGLNDSSASREAIRAAARDTYSKLRRAGVKVLIVGPFWPNGEPSSDVLAVRDITREEASAAGFPFIDPLAERWVTARNQALVTGPDHTHPTQAGHDNITGRLLADLKRLKL